VRRDDAVRGPTTSKKGAPGQDALRNPRARRPAAAITTAAGMLLKRRDVI
jgi:hypothetical protein